MNLSLPLSTLGHFRLAIGACFFNQGLVFSSWASRIPDVKNALHLSDGALGSLLFAIPAGQLCAMALSGYLVSRYGSQKMLLTAGLLYPGGLVAAGAASSVWTLSVALFLFGMAANLHNISVNTQAVGVERLYGRSIMAAFHGIWSLAGFVGGVIGAWTVGLHLSPSTHFASIFLLTFAVLVTARPALLPRDAPKGRQTAPEKRKKGFTRPDKYIVLLGVIAFGSMICEGTMFDWSGVYFASVVRPPEQWVRLGYIACMGTMACGRFLADRLVTRFGVVPVVRSCGLAVSAGLLVSVCFPSLLPATLGFLLVGLGISSTVPICYSLAGKSRTLHPSVALAAVSTIGFLGFLLGPPLIGHIAQALDLRHAFGSVACIGVLTFFLAPRLNAFLGKS